MKRPSGLATVTQLEWSTWPRPTAIKSTTILTFKTTKAALTLAEVSMPTMSNAVTSATTSIAGKLTTAPVLTKWSIWVTLSATQSKGAEA